MPKTIPNREPRPTVNTRVSADLREKLVVAAQASGRTLTQEVEFRLELSFVRPGVSADELVYRINAGVREVFRESPWGTVLIKREPVV